MRLEDWHVIAVNDDITRRHYVYGDAEECGFTDADVKIAMGDWTVEDMVQITANLLEDVNHHSECDNPIVITSLMEQAGIDDMRKAMFMRGYMKHMFQKYGY